MFVSSSSPVRYPASAKSRVQSADRHLHQVHVMLFEAMVCAAALIGIAAALLQHLG